MNCRQQVGAATASVVGKLRQQVPTAVAETTQRLRGECFKPLVHPQDFTGAVHHANTVADLLKE
jgi:hypothetical protein